MKFKKLYLV